MPAIAAPTALTIAAGSAGDPVVDLSWNHVGTNLVKFEVLRSANGGPWRSWIGPKPSVDFRIVGGKYVVRTAATESDQFLVRAFSTDTVSVTNPTVPFAGTVDGVWFIPLANDEAVDAARAWIGANSPTVDVPRTVDVFDIPSRRVKVSQSGLVHPEEGAVEGMILTRNGQTAEVWLARVTDLLTSQVGFRVVLVCPRYVLDVELLNVSKTPIQAGGRSWNVIVPFRGLV